MDLFVTLYFCVSVGTRNNKISKGKHSGAFEKMVLASVVQTEHRDRKQSPAEVYEQNYVLFGD